MAEPLSLEDFADRTQAEPEEIERFRARGFLDVDGDDLFDARDVMRLHFLRRLEAEGHSLDDLQSFIANDELHMHLFSSAKKISVDEAVERTGLSVEHLIALSSALGLASDGSVTEEDLDMISEMKGMIAAGFPWEAILEGARVYGDTLRRLAEANLQMTHRYLCDPLIREGKDEREISARVQEAIGVIGPSAERLLARLYQRYMVDAAIEHEAAHLEPPPSDAPPGSMRSTIVFVDLSLFSSYTYLEGDEAAVEVVDRFDRAVRSFCVAHKGRVVKAIGDEFMLIFREPVDAVRFAIELRDSMGRNDEGVQLRTGIHHGSVLYRLGDYWGNAVNVAARIVSMAMPNSILVTEPVAKAALEAGIEAEEIGVRSLRGMEEPLALYRIKQ